MKLYDLSHKMYDGLTTHPFHFYEEGQTIEKETVESIPLTRMGTPQDVADAAAFLSSDEAGFVTGQTLYVCGGLTVGTSPI